MYFAQNLKYLRIKVNEKQKELAGIIGVSEMTISRYEHEDCEPELLNLIKLAKHYDVTVDDLLVTQLQKSIPIYIKNIRYLRKKYAMTLKDLAELISTSIKNMEMYEQFCKEISIEQLIKISEYFDITLDQLVKQDLSIVKE